MRKPAIAYDKVLFGGTWIHYGIRRSAERRTLSISVGQGGVCIAAPSGMRTVSIQPIVLSRGTWIVAKLDECRRLRKHWPRKLVSGEAVSYLGRQYPLKVRRTADRTRIGLRLWGGMFHLTLPQGLDAEEALAQGRRIIRSWFRAHLQPRLADPVQHFAKALRVKPPKVRVLDLGGRWGSCKPKGGIAFHWHLATASPRLIEYVAAHEMCHLRHGKHDKQFYKTLTRIMPRWRIRDEELQRCGGVGALSPRVL